MKKIILTLIVSSFFVIANCQDPKSEYNFNFEKTEKGSPSGWINTGNEKYNFSLDSSVKHSGKYAAVIESKAGNPDFGYMKFTIPHSYSGRKIKLTGYIKTENVTGGTAGLWLRIDPSIAYVDMSSDGPKGSTRWKKYELSLDLNPERTTQILVGGMLIGKGKMWIDDLKVHIDGKEINTLKPYQRKMFPAETDTMFNAGSGIASFSVDKNQIENLKTLGLVWGFLKYHHPAIARGTYNWDFQLFRILPKILKSENNNTRDQILTQWIHELGEFPEGKPVVIKASEIKIKPDLDWISESGLSKGLSDLLLKVKNADRPTEHFYIGLKAGVGNPDFKHEEPYWSMKHDDAGYRILALYRYWNIIQYYFPYKNLIEEDWKSVLEEFIPKFIAADNEKAYTLASLELIGRVHDTHANVWGAYNILNNFHGLNYAPVDLTFIENQAVVTGFHDTKPGTESGLAIGDVITSINKQPVEDIVKSRLKYYPASNYPTKLRDIGSNLLRTNDSAINIEYLRNGKKENKILKTFSTNEVTIKYKYATTDTSFRMINKDIAYINNGSMKRADLAKFWKRIASTKGLIIDDRNYPSDFIIDDLSNYLMPDSTPFVKFSNGSIAQPGLFTFTGIVKTGKKNKDYYKGKVVILINEISQSSSEFHAMAYRVHPNATVIGSTTAGADGNVSQFYLPGGVNTMISGIGVYYPDGKETQRIGIVPDIEVKPTIEGIRNGKDELLEKAIEIINKN